MPRAAVLLLAIVAVASTQVLPPPCVVPGYRNLTEPEIMPYTMAGYQYLQFYSWMFCDTMPQLGELQIERRLGVGLPQDEALNPTPADPMQSLKDPVVS